MAEWSKAHAWKVCIPQKGIKGSNPFFSAHNIYIFTEKRRKYLSDKIQLEIKLNRESVKPFN